MTFPPSCGTCRYAEVRMGDDDAPRMVCRRYPPVMFVVDAEPFVALPDVAADDWCGEYEPAS